MPRPFPTSPIRLRMAVAALAVMTAPAAAMPLSGSGNADFLRPGHGACVLATGCGPATLTPVPAQPQATINPPAHQPQSRPTAAAAPPSVYYPNNAVSEDRLLPSSFATAPAAATFSPDLTPPSEPYDPFFDIDWSLELRGALISDGGGELVQALALPAVVMRHDGVRATLELSAGATVVQPLGDDTGFRVEEGEIAVRGNYDLDALTLLEGGVSLAVAQEDPAAPDNQEEPQIVTGAADIGLATRFGRLGVDLDAGLIREVALETQGGDAAARSFTEAGADIRVGYAVTPILEAFAGAGVDHRAYDGAAADLGARADAWTYALRAGVVANWSDVLVLEGAIGHAGRQFEDPAIGDFDTILYEASISFVPSETVTLSASLGTSLLWPEADSSALGGVEHELRGEASYRLNRHLGLNASASARWARTVGGEEIETGYGAGLGASFVVNDHMVISADYDFSRTETPPDAPEDSHQVTLGVTFSR